MLPLVILNTLNIDWLPEIGYHLLSHYRQQMEITEGIRLRKSIRGYKPIPAPKEILMQILEIATHAPSTTNIQPWKFTVLGGKTLDELKIALQEKFLAGEESQSDFGPTPSYTGVYRERQVALAKNLFQLMNIARDDRGKRIEWDLKAFRFFDAPNAIIISIDEAVSNFLAILSLGIVIQTIALTATDFGLGTCIERAPVDYPKVIRRITGIPESEKIAIGIAIGYPDWDFPANKLESSREPSENITSWLGV